MKMNNECFGCGSMVTDKFAKVFGDNEDEVHHCMNCIEKEAGGSEALRWGAGATDDIETVSH